MNIKRTLALFIGLGFLLFATTLMTGCQADASEDQAKERSMNEAITLASAKLPDDMPDEVRAITGRSGGHVGSALPEITDDQIIDLIEAEQEGNKFNFCRDIVRAQANNIYWHYRKKDESVEKVASFYSNHAYGRMGDLKTVQGIGGHHYDVYVPCTAWFNANPAVGVTKVTEVEFEVIIKVHPQDALGKKWKKKRAYIFSTSAEQVRSDFLENWDIRS